MTGYLKLWIAIIILLQVLISTAGGVAAAYFLYYNKKRICPGVEISGVLLGDLKLSEAKEKLEKELLPLRTISLKGEQKNYTISFTDDVYSYLIDEALGKALVLTDPFVGGWDKTLNVVRWHPYRLEAAAPVSLSSSFLLKELEALRQYIDREPEDATLFIEKGVPVYLEEKEGRRLNVSETLIIIEKHLKDGRLEQIPLEVDTVPPRITKEQLPNFQRCLASYETFIEMESFSNRSHNIELAALALNGRIIEPGQTFSFNETVGPPTKDKGFLEAPVLRNRKLTTDVGGGICQVATTLYQAALRAQLEIRERARHSRPVSYVPLGQDATVAYDLLDLKIKNNRDFPLLITGHVEADTLFIAIWGAEKDDNKIVEIITEDIEVIHPSILEHPDPNLAKGSMRLVQKGEEGYRVKVYRIIYEDGAEESKELISTDLYPPVNEIVHIGTKEIIHVKK